MNRFLQPDEALVSPDGLYSFAMRPSGRMELWAGDALAAADARALVAAFRLTDDGEAQFLPSLPDPLAPSGAWVSLRDDGQLALLGEAGEELWRSGDAANPEGGQ
ncbi:MAG: hypothetical protein PSV23_02030 [Brevundimonas sp.]|uniref:hypothetical protein n=1 Tax=Brevundimonas sp. TaxID=1871086 RepID=UPI0024898085|nr:hypothetical protein [Brevundimonas sp.]MDI1325556.1 hypothetical protein [Brevundimonas sp.]